MKIKIEVSRPHYHPSYQTAEELTLTKKRDLSVPPHWVANERVIDRQTGESLAVVMPPREEELYEYRQGIHIHCDEATYRELGEVDVKVIWIKGKEYAANVKVSEDYNFPPTIHIDHIFSQQEDITSEDEATA